MISLSDGISVLEIDLASWDDDAYITVKIDSRGYSGLNDLHVLAVDFKNFCKDLLSLQATLKGSAELNSVIPNELHIKIQPLDSLGHISVTGKTGYQIHTQHSCNWHSVEFGFEVDPQELDKVAKVEWVKKYAA